MNPLRASPIFLYESTAPLDDRFLDFLEGAVSFVLSSSLAFLMTYAPRAACLTLNRSDSFLLGKACLWDKHV